MIKRLLSLGIAVALGAALVIPALAVENSTENFIRQKSYAGEFTDIIPETTFYDNATALYEYGLSAGKKDGSFGMKDPVTVGQIVIFAGRIRSLYAVGDSEAGAAGFQQEGQAAFEPYLAYLQENGVLNRELDGRYKLAATRGQVAYVLARTLPQSALPLVNQKLVDQGYKSHRYLSDVTEENPYQQEILTLYKAGVTVGSDARGSFKPDRTITRGAVAAMLTRMIDPNLRLVPDWDLSIAVTVDTAANATWGSLITGNTTYVPDPVTNTEIIQDVAYMLSREESILSLHYETTISTDFVSQVMNLAMDEVKSYCEQMYNSVECSYETNTGEVTMSFYTLATGLNVQPYRDFTLKAAAAVHDRLWEDGVVTAGMSEKEKAWAYYKWICDNCTYDKTAGDDSLSHIAYSLFKNNIAVCDGYTGAYNLLLKLEGIQCYGLSNDNHIWTVAELDGTEYHIDSTWGDGVDMMNNAYFAMTPKQSWQYHSW